MANNCNYSMRAVGKDRASLERLVKILKYEDGEFYIYRVFGVNEGEIERNLEKGYFAIGIYGDVAWSATDWIHDAEDFNSKSKSGAHYSNFTKICPALNIGVEIFTEEEGVGFQEHYIVNHDGVVAHDECQNWKRGYDYFDKDGNPCNGEDDWQELEPNEEKDEGGVDGYMDYADDETIYGKALND